MSDTPKSLHDKHYLPGHSHLSVISFLNPDTKRWSYYKYMCRECLGTIKALGHAVNHYRSCKVLNTKVNREKQNFYKKFMLDINQNQPQ